MAKGQADDVAIICYTSGTTGQPKGTMLSFRNLIVTGRNAIEYEGLRATDEVVAYLPMAWIGDHMFSFAQSILTGFTTNCPESTTTVLHDLREIGPTYFFAPPGIYQRILTTAMIRIEDSRDPSGGMVRFFLDRGAAGRAAAAGRKAGAVGGARCSTRWAGCSSTARSGTTSG